MRSWKIEEQSCAWGEPSRIALVGPPVPMGKTAHLLTDAAHFLRAEQSKKGRWRHGVVEAFPSAADAIELMAPLGWACEEHPDQDFEHDGCIGPGIVRQPWGATPAPTAGQDRGPGA